MPLGQPQLLVVLVAFLGLPAPKGAPPTPSVSSPPSLVLAWSPQEALPEFRVGVEQPDHLVVFVIQHSGQEERGFLCPAGLKAPPGSSLAVDGDVPESLSAGSALAARPAGDAPVQAGRVRVVPQLVDPLHELTLRVVALLEREQGKNKPLSQALVSFRTRTSSGWWDRRQEGSAEPDQGAPHQQGEHTLSIRDPRRRPQNKKGDT